MTGLVQLPPGTAGCIFFSLPDPNAPPTWHYLGYLTNERPSAIYKLSNLTQSQLRVGSQESETQTTLTQTNNSNGGLGFNYSQSPVHHVAQIGISVEPMDSVSQMIPACDTSASKISSFAEFINKTVGNLYNYCSSFSRPASELLGNPFQNSPPNNAQYIPLSTLQTWYDNYTRRLSHDQNFWKSLK